MDFREHFDAAQWLAWLDNPGDERMRSHLAGCEACAALYSSVQALRLAMEADAARVCADAATPAEIERMLERCLGEIRAGSHTGWSTVQAVLLLRLLLEPICGRGAAGATISLARRRAAGAGQDELTARNWSVFVANLSEAMSSICGAAAGRLVRRAGLSIALQEG